MEKIEKWWTNYELINEWRKQNILPNLWKRLDKLTSEVWDIDDALIALNYWEVQNTPYFDYKIRWRRDAKKLRDSMVKYNKELIKIAGLTQTSAGEHLRETDLVSLQNYLEWVINWEINPATQPFTPEQERAYKYLQTIDTTLQDSYWTLPKTWITWSKAWGNTWSFGSGNQAPVETGNQWTRAWGKVI